MTQAQNGLSKTKQDLMRVYDLLEVRLYQMAGILIPPSGLIDSAIDPNTSELGSEPPVIYVADQYNGILDPKTLLRLDAQVERFVYLSDGTHVFEIGRGTLFQPGERVELIFQPVDKRKTTYGSRNRQSVERVAVVTPQEYREGLPDSGSLELRRYLESLLES